MNKQKTKHLILSYDQMIAERYENYLTENSVYFSNVNKIFEISVFKLKITRLLTFLLLVTPLLGVKFELLGSTYLEKKCSLYTYL